MKRLFCSSFQNREKKTVGFYEEKNLKMGVHEGYFSLQKKYQSVYSTKHDKHPCKKDRST